MNESKVSIVLFHCFFNGSESITHFEHTFDLALYDSLENLYCVLISDNSGLHRKITAGFAIKTTLDHDHPEFLDLLSGSKLVIPEFENYLIKNATSFIPAKLITGESPLTEKEFLQIMHQQYMRYNIDGLA